ncbi:hypothetical protein NUQ34_03225 [Glaesserella parasuis]|uniref:Uncharacterized protein n=1 Tax=Glaesserella parasuis TaxID=738 RepID=A0AAX1M5Y9_GLAPU|nr:MULTISPECIES: hypothetical protein [Pasteurellaceae]MCT8517666.1 hypothetical protein [Glaesserella parasuis]MCT8557110.1 hypothetical protein [Glaesserella parasuis]MCT8781752.1 hypothetical protein [Glaesserella parasuis]MCT8822044.1 hypothetical protein [Glaesserella parasuis]MDD7545200.1 hypothetical protein [Actinobacillus porcinus]
MENRIAELEKQIDLLKSAKLYHGVILALLPRVLTQSQNKHLVELIEEFITLDDKSSKPLPEDVVKKLRSYIEVLLKQ